jgi:predicted nucleic acid-binding protein
MIVVDVNTIAYLWLPGQFTSSAEAALSKDPHWAAPFLWRSEFRNILAGYMRCGAMGREDVDRCIVGAENQLSRHEYLVPSAMVMAKVHSSTCSAYDCEYVALATDLGVALVTCDRQILREFPDVAISLHSFTED